jgi:hypothetical protein
MLTTVDYLLAWAVYLLAAAVLLLTLWRLSARFWVLIKDPLRATTAVLLLTPGSVDAEGNFLAPAVFIVAFELLTAEGGGIGPLLGVRLLLFVIFAVVGALLLRLSWYWLVASRRARPASRAAVEVKKKPRDPQRRAVEVRARAPARERR